MAKDLEPVTYSRIFYLVLEFSTPAVMGMIERDCRVYDRRDRELIPQDWQIETTSDYMGGCTVTFSKDEGGPFSDEEVEPVRAAIQGIEETYRIMTRNLKPKG